MKDSLKLKTRLLVVKDGGREQQHDTVERAADLGGMLFIPCLVLKEDEVAFINRLKELDMKGK